MLSESASLPEQVHSSLPEDADTQGKISEELSRSESKVLEAIEKCCSDIDDCLKLPSEQARVAVRLCNELCSNFKSKSNGKTRAACANIVDMLAKCIPLQRFRKRWREKMWKDFHQTRLSTRFTSSWSELLATITGNTDKIELLSQHITDIIFQAMLSSSLKPSTTIATQSVDITPTEENALRYISGYVISKLKKRIAKSEHTLKNELLVAIKEFMDDDDDSGSSSRWTSLVDRGGLCRVNEDTYTFFYEMEVVLKRFLCIEKVTDMDSKFKEVVFSAMRSDEDVVYVWSKITAEIGEAASKYLFNQIITLYFTIRGNSFSKSIMEMYKRSNTKTVQKSKGIRKKINTD